MQQALHESKEEEVSDLHWEWLKARAETESKLQALAGNPGASRVIDMLIKEVEEGKK